MNLDAVDYALTRTSTQPQEDEGLKADVLARITEAFGVPFSEEQLAVITHTGAPLAVISCAGAGKTTVILAKMFYRELYYGIPAHSMLAISFNTKAKIELEERYCRARVKLGLDINGLPTFKTFHGLFYGLIQQFKGKINVVSEGGYTYELMKEIPFSQYQEKKEILQAILDYRSKVINNSISYDAIHSAKVEGMLVPIESGNVDEETYFKVIRKYNEMKRMRVEIDFDDMLVFLYRMTVVEPNSRLIAAFQQAYQEVYIDEFQDISEILMKVMDVLVADKKKLTVIGDDDQTIYSFRGSKDTYILNFHLNYTGAKLLFLGDNYRCPSEILNPVISSIEKNEGRLFKPIRASKPGGSTFFYPTQDTYTPLLEAVVDEVNLMHGRLDDVALIMRTNAQKMIFADLLASHQIPVDVGNRYYILQENKIYKAVRGIIQAIRTKDNQLFVDYGRQFMPELNYPTVQRYKGNTTDNWYEDIIERNKYLLAEETIKRIKAIATIDNAADLIRYVWLLTKYYHNLNASKGFGNLDSVIATYKYMTKTAEGLTYKQYCAKEAEKGMFTSAYTGMAQTVKLHTFHAVKGLEFETVFLVGLDDAVFPNPRYMESLEEKPKELEAYISEERRLFYVGWTRAKQRLYVAFNKDTPCQFLKEVNHPQLHRILGTEPENETAS